MKRITYIALLVACLAARAVAQPIPATLPTARAVASDKPRLPSIDPFFTFYASNLRGSLFSGFLTLGSFLVAVNTFMVVNLKKEVYDHAAYKQRVIDAKRGDPNSSFYGALRRLSGLLLFTIFAALVTSISQLTIGVLFSSWIAATICLSFAAITMAILFFTLWKIRQNLGDWFTFIEKDAEAIYQKSIRFDPLNSQRSPVATSEK